MPEEIILNLGTESRFLGERRKLRGEFESGNYRQIFLKMFLFANCKSQFNHANPIPPCIRGRGGGGGWKKASVCSVRRTFL